MTKEKLNCFPHDKFNPHYAAHTQMVTDSNGDDDDNDDDWKHHFQLSGYLMQCHRSFYQRSDLSNASLFFFYQVNMISESKILI